MRKKVTARIYSDIDCYITNTMSESREKHFLIQISSDKELADKALITTLMIKGLREEGRALDAKIADEIIKCCNSK